eukprot:2635218-Pyramimonas_sp.AAC.1
MCVAGSWSPEHARSSFLCFACVCVWRSTAAPEECCSSAYGSRCPQWCTRLILTGCGHATT